MTFDVLLVVGAVLVAAATVWMQGILGKDSSPLPGAPAGASIEPGRSGVNSRPAVAFVAVTTTPPPDLARKVSQLDNDVGAIYTMLNGIQTTQERHGNRLEELGQGLAGLRGTQERQGNRLEELGQDLAGLRSDVGRDLAGLRSEVAAILELLRAGGRQT
ncbi:MAG: hypothetical protein M3Y91_17575 [Actinomycetota bacterium]|nr:hypothetical protein [Actinomycetota bacterium]